MQGALAELATTSIDRLKGKHLEAEDFDRLFSDDPAKDLLLWMSDPDAVKSGWKDGRWAAFKSCCKADFELDPDKDGELDGAERLGKREGPWATVWERFTESPVLYPGLPELLRRAMPHELFVEPSSWPQSNEKEEETLRQALLGLERLAPVEARERVLELEKLHGPRAGWVWAKLGAHAIGHLARLVEVAATTLAGASLAEMATLYSDGSWEADAAALAAAAAVKSTADAQALSKALDAVYRPWLESAAFHLQALAEKEPLPGHDGQALEELLVDPGHHRLDRKCMAMAAPGSDRCTRHHLEAFTQQRALNRRRRLCGCGAQPDPGHRTCALCRTWAWWSKRCQRNPALRLDYRTQQFIRGYLDHGNAARAVRESGLGEGSGARRKGWQLLQKPHVRAAIAARSAAVVNYAHQRAEDDARVAALTRDCRARSPGAPRADRLARSRGSRAQAKATHAAAS